MTKGKFGLPLSAIAVIAFVFAALNQPVAVLLVVGFAFLAEKDEWLGRQTMQALLLNLAYSLAVLAFNMFFRIFDAIFDWTDATKAGIIFIEIHSVINYLLLAALIVFALLGTVKILFGKDANLPLLSIIAGGNRTKATAAPAPAQQPAQEVPAVQKTPVQENPVQEAATDTTVSVPVEHFCSNCGKKLGENNAFCPECGTKVE